MKPPSLFTNREEFWQEIGKPVLIILGLHIPELLILLGILFYVYGFWQSYPQLPPPTDAVQ